MRFNFFGEAFKDFTTFNKDMQSITIRIQHGEVVDTWMNNGEFIFAEQAALVTEDYRTTVCVPEEIYKTTFLNNILVPI